MVNILIFAPYIIAGGIMWLLLHQLAPIGHEFGLGRTILGVVLMGFCEKAAYALIFPHFGYWCLLGAFLVSVVFVMFFFQLRFWPSFRAVFIYNAVFIGAALLIDYGAKHPLPA
jgi:hypothetical protein